MYLYRHGMRERVGGGIFKLFQRKMLSRILYPARLSFRIDGEIKTFQNHQSLTNFETTKPALQEILRGGSIKSKKAPRVIQNRKQQPIQTKTLLATWHH